MQQLKRIMSGTDVFLFTCNIKRRPEKHQRYAHRAVITEKASESFTASMKIVAVISLLLAVASAQFFPGIPFPGYGRFPPEDQYAASLGGAPVGVYDKKHFRGVGPFGGSASDVTGASLGGAKVGIYGKEHPQQSGPGFIPYAAPVVRPYPLPYRKPLKPVYAPRRPPVY